MTGVVLHIDLRPYRGLASRRFRPCRFKRRCCSGALQAYMLPEAWVVDRTLLSWTATCALIGRSLLYVLQATSLVPTQLEALLTSWVVAIRGKLRPRLIWYWKFTVLIRDGTTTIFFCLARPVVHFPGPSVIQFLILGQFGPANY